MLAVTEWNCNYQDGTEQEQTMEAAICNAGMLNAFIRMGSAVHISMISDLINGWPGGIIRSRNGYCYGTPSYYVLAMYAQARPTSLLSCQYDSPDYAAAEVGNLKAFPHIPYLDVAACKTEDERICALLSIETWIPPTQLNFLKTLSLHPSRHLQQRITMPKTRRIEKQLLPITRSVRSNALRYYPVR